MTNSCSKPIFIIGFCFVAILSVSLLLFVIPVHLHEPPRTTAVLVDVHNLTILHPSAPFVRGDTQIMSWGAARSSGYNPPDIKWFSVKGPSLLIYLIDSKLLDKPTMLQWTATGEEIGYLAQ